MSLMQMSLTGSVLILVIAVLRAFTISRLPKVTFMILWLVAVFRLLLPCSLPSRLSLYTWMKPIIDSNLKSGLSMQKIPANISLLRNTAENSPPFIFILEILWLTGTILLGVYFTISYLRCQKKFRMSLPVKNDFVTKWLRGTKAFKTVEVRSSDQVLSPLTYGLFHPVILLPKKIDWKNETALRYILTHEYVHIRRFDAVTKIILAVTLCIHWWNPIVWLMYFLANRDIELSCDETVVHICGEEEKASYALILICMEEAKKLPFSVSSHFSKNSIQERISAIMKIKKNSVLGIAAALVLVAGTTTVFATNAQNKSTDEVVSKEIDKNDKRIAVPTIDINSFFAEEEMQNSTFPVTDSNDTTNYYINGTDTKNSKLTETPTIDINSFFEEEMQNSTFPGTDSNDTTNYYIKRSDTKD